MWIDVETTEVQTGNLIDSELLNKFRGNLNYAICFGNLRRGVPNYSFELATGTVPKFWSITTANSGGVAIATGCHGNNSIKLTHPGGASGVVAEIWSTYVPQGQPTLGDLGISEYWVWADNTAVVGGIGINVYDRNYSLIASYSTMQSSYTATPTKRTHAGWALSTNARYYRVGFRLSTAATVAGNIYVDCVIPG